MTRRLLAALAVLAALVAPAWAVSTLFVTLTTSWQDLGPGPLQVQVKNQSQAIYQIADSAPAAGTDGFNLQGSSTQTISTTSHVFVRLRSPVANAVLIYAPVR